jgi:hypothetical protein
MRLFFPRGRGPLVSVLICSRGRSQHLIDAVASCVNLAEDPTRLEFIIKYDVDDLETGYTVERLRGELFARGIQVVPLCGPRGKGYHDIHKWTDWMCREASGDWLFVFNDDARICTPSWDRVLLYIAISRPWAGVRDLCLLVAITIDRPAASEFILMRRKLYQLIGNVGLSLHADNWIHSICLLLEMRKMVMVQIKHLSDTINDQVRAESSIAYETTIESLVCPSSLRRRWQDAGKLLTYLERSDAVAGWTEAAPTLPGWYRWRSTQEVPQQSVLIGDAGEVAVLEDDRWGAVYPTAVEMGGLWAVLDGADTILC